jgi:hypothetical protein
VKGQEEMQESSTEIARGSREVSQIISAFAESREKA